MTSVKPGHVHHYLLGDPENKKIRGHLPAEPRLQRPTQTAGEEVNDTEVAAGPELDVMVAERIMEWKPGDSYLHGHIYISLPDGTLRSTMAFSTTWEGAGLVVERMRELGWGLMATTKRFPDRWKMLFTHGQHSPVKMAGPTFPEAVARAALEAINA